MNTHTTISQINIFLVGPMGAGKTTVGILLAKKLNRQFFDSDRFIEEQTGANIPLIFELEGEEGFRKREITAIDTLTEKPNIVLATGGGAVLKQVNRRHLRSRGLVIYLYADIERLLERTSHDTNRPLLNTENPRQKLIDLMDIRDPLYREVADEIIDTDDLPVINIVQSILKRVKKY